MTVWAEEPRDGGSAVWGCDRCEQGGWCSDHTTAFIEARAHAINHREKVTIHGQPKRGPRINHDRDQHILELRATHTLRAIGAIVGLSASGVAKALARRAS